MINSNKIYLVGAGDYYPSSQSLLNPFGVSSGVGSLVNLDRQIDQRLVRIGQNKTQSELPPTGVDSVVWFSNDIINNVSQGNVIYGQTNLIPPIGNQNIPFNQNDFYLLVFHELLESYMEVEYGFQYLDRDCYFSLNGRQTGSHSFSIIIELNYLRVQRNLRRDVTGGVLRRR